jgi:hypothetical protein
MRAIRPAGGGALGQRALPWLAARWGQRALPEQLTGEHVGWVGGDGKAHAFCRA